MGRSISLYSKSRKTLSGAQNMPTVVVNSVNMTSGRPYFAVMARQAKSVTPSMGDRAMMGRFGCCQNPGKGVDMGLFIMELGLKGQEPICLLND